MEYKVFSKFNIYDQIGYLMVGAITVIVLCFDLYYFFELSFIPPLNIDNFLVWFVIAYFLGHLTQGIANLINKIKFLNFLIPEKKDEFSESEVEILQKAKKYFGLEKQDNNQLWKLCQMLTSIKDITGYIQSFNACYGLYRGWFVVFLVETIFLIYRLLFFSINSFTIFLLILSSIFCFVFYIRSKKFYSYLRSKVIQSFVVIEKLNL